MNLSRPLEVMEQVAKEEGLTPQEFTDQAIIIFVIFALLLAWTLLGKDSDY
jgi:hypothetical protein